MLVHEDGTLRSRRGLHFFLYLRLVNVHVPVRQRGIKVVSLELVYIFLLVSSYVYERSFN